MGKLNLSNQHHGRGKKHGRQPFFPRSGWFAGHLSQCHIITRAVDCRHTERMDALLVSRSRIVLAYYCCCMFAIPPRGYCFIFHLRESRMLQRAFKTWPPGSYGGSRIPSGFADGNKVYDGDSPREVTVRASPRRVLGRSIVYTKKQLAGLGELHVRSWSLEIYQVERDDLNLPYRAWPNCLDETLLGSSPTVQNLFPSPAIASRLLPMSLVLGFRDAVDVDRCRSLAEL